MVRMTIAWALMLTMASASLALAPARQLLPQWKKGDSWTLKTEYREVAHRDGHDQLSWSKPVTFQYTVSNRKEEGGRTVYTIQAQPKAQHTGFATELTMVAEGGKLSCTKVRTLHLRQGKFVTEENTFAAGSPVFTESSIIPYDAPAFPLVQPAELNASNFLSVKKKFQRVEEMGGLKFAKVQSQLVKPAGAVSNYVDADGKAVDFAVPVEASRVFPVEMAEETTGTKIVQYWAEGLPWAAYSENGSSRSWLVR